MEVIAGILALLALVGVVLAIYERRKGISWVDERTPAPQTEADRDAIRAEDATRSRTMSDMGGHG